MNQTLTTPQLKDTVTTFRRNEFPLGECAAHSSARRFEFSSPSSCCLSAQAVPGSITGACFASPNQEVANHYICHPYGGGAPTLDPFASYELQRAWQSASHSSSSRTNHATLPPIATKVNICQETQSTIMMHQRASQLVMEGSPLASPLDININEPSGAMSPISIPSAPLLALTVNLYERNQFSKAANLRSVPRPVIKADFTGAEMQPLPHALTSLRAEDFRKHHTDWQRSMSFLHDPSSSLPSAVSGLDTIDMGISKLPRPLVATNASIFASDSEPAYPVQSYCTTGALPQLLSTSSSRSTPDSFRMNEIPCSNSFSSYSDFRASSLNNCGSADGAIVDARGITSQGTRADSNAFNFISNCTSPRLPSHASEPLCRPLPTTEMTPCNVNAVSKDLKRSLPAAASSSSIVFEDRNLNLQLGAPAAVRLERDASRISVDERESFLPFFEINEPRANELDRADKNRELPVPVEALPPRHGIAELQETCLKIPRLDPNPEVSSQPPWPPPVASETAPSLPASDAKQATTVKVSCGRRQKAYESIIDCGFVAANGKRQYSIHSPFFGDEIKVYRALSDPQQRFLFKTVDVALHFKCSPNMLAMYLKRRRALPESGIYQATDILHREEGQAHVKAGCYFITLEACRQIREYLDLKEFKSTWRKGPFPDAMNCPLQPPNTGGDHNQ
jgi:hypothetical protein